MRIAMKNSEPARLPKKDTNQLLPRSRTLVLRCSVDIVKNYELLASFPSLDKAATQSIFEVSELTITLLVNRSAPVRTIITRPGGKTIAPTVRIRPGAFV
jgi:hypothetical protein